MKLAPSTSHGHHARERGQETDEGVADTSLDMRDAWQRVGLHRMFKGDDWRGTERAAQWERDVAAVGVEVVYLPYTAHVSSTAIRRELRNPVLDAGERV